MSGGGSRYVVIGAGPAGLTAARELARRGRDVEVLEQGHIVGGLARTESYKGFHFYMGGHRFFTKVGAVNELWRAPEFTLVFFAEETFVVLPAAGAPAEFHDLFAERVRAAGGKVR